MICTILALIISIISLRLSKKKKGEHDEAQRENLVIWFYFFLIIAIANMVHLTWRFGISNILLIEIFERTGNSLFYFACFIRVFKIEKSLIRLGWYRRYYFSSMVWITILINSIIPTTTLKEISYLQVLFLVLIALGYVMFPLIYLYVAKKSTGKARLDAFKVNRAAILFFFGYLFRPENLVKYGELSTIMGTLVNALFIVSPITIMIAALLIYDSFRK